MLETIMKAFAISRFRENVNALCSFPLIYDFRLMSDRFTSRECLSLRAYLENLPLGRRCLGDPMIDKYFSIIF